MQFKLYTVYRFRTDDILAKEAVWLAESFFPEGYLDPYTKFRQLLAFSNGANYLSNPALWKPGAKPLVGCFGYNLKNQFENLHTANTDPVGMPDMAFFEPQGWYTNDDFEIEDRFARFMPSKTHVSARFSKKEYVEIIHRLKEHLQYGDMYEITFSMDFFAEAVFADPFSLYVKLNEVSPMPFSSFLKLGQKYLISASPERFLASRSGKIITQPIKGTAPRFSNAEMDAQSASNLLHSEKERAENIMIVDLSRNDLSRVAAPGTVQVDELCGLYTFPKVHQLISTVSCTLKEGLDSADVLRAVFPPGSMTGAPKIRAMERIEQYENSNRGLFGGSVGYLLPDGDFDLNVVIRSIFYNASTGYLSFRVGGAITLLSDPEAEYEECLLKAEAIAQILNVNLKA